MMRSLNFWLFILLAICGVSFLSAAGYLPDLERDETREPTPEKSLESIQLKVLNGVGITGLARDFSLLLPGLGCLVQGVGDAEGDWPESMLVNRRLSLATARNLASRLGNVALIQQWDERCSEDAVLVLGADHEAILQTLKDGAGRH